MDSCDFCGASTDHAFNCNYCGQDLCSDHRLPEKHDCPMHSGGGDKSSFGGEGPSTRDRRSTTRKRHERVRSKETSRENPPTETRNPQSKGDYRDDEQEKEVLTCPSCGKNTDQVFDCEDCGQSVCPECEAIFEHECPVGVKKDKDDTNSTISKLLSIFR